MTKIIKRSPSLATNSLTAARRTILFFALVLGFFFVSEACTPPPATGGSISGTCTGLTPPTITGDINVPAGQTLCLTNSTLTFAPGVKFIVNSGAQVRLENCTFQSTGTSSVWDGFVVYGNSGLSQTDPGQTVFYMKNSTVDQAVIGIDQWAGAVLKIEQTTFNNCSAQSVRMNSYFTEDSDSRIAACTFFHDKAISTNWPDRSNAHFILVDGICGVQVDSSTFENAKATSTVDMTERGFGIKSTTQIDIYKNEFRGLWRAVQLNLYGHDLGCGVSNVVNNLALNTQEGIVNIGQDKVLIYDNAIRVNDDNINYLAATSSNRRFSGISNYAAGNGHPTGVLIVDNLVRYNETTAASGAQSMTFFGIASQAGPGTSTFIEHNRVRLNLLPAPATPGVFHCMNTQSGAVTIQCNYFNLDNATSQTQTGLRNSGAAVTMGGPQSSGNQFTFNPNCGGSTEHIYSTTALTAFTASPYIVGPGLTCVSAMVTVSTTPMASNCGTYAYSFAGHDLTPPTCPTPKMASTGEAWNSASMEINPNPVVDGEVHIRVSEIGGEIVLRNLQGQTLQVLRPNSVEFSLDLNQLSNGLYILEYRMEGKAPLLRKMVISGH